VRAFCLTNAQLRAAEQTERFVSNRHRIIQQARKPGPYIYGSTNKGSDASGPRTKLPSVAMAQHDLGVDDVDVLREPVSSHMEA
jgi:hypothetical protein